MLRVLGFYPEGTQETVVVESDIDGTPGREFSLAIAELQGANARNMALAHARRSGIADPGCGMSQHPYPTDADGKPITNAIGPDKKPIPTHRYRVNVPIVSAGI